MASLFSYETLVHAVAGATIMISTENCIDRLDTESCINRLDLSVKSRWQAFLYKKPNLVKALRNCQWWITTCQCMQLLFTTLGSIVGMTVFYPLDTLRSRQQVEDSKKLEGSAWEVLLKLANDEGFDTLYRGLTPVLQSLSVSNFVYFYTFHALRRNASTTSALQDLMFGVIAGSINVILTSPLWVVNTRMKFDKNRYSSLLGGLMEVAKKEGAKGLWSGTIPSLLLVSNPAIQFMVYESIKRNLTAKGSFDTYTAFMTGALAKAVATTLTYPIQLIQSRLRAGTSIKPLLKDVKTNPLVMFRGLEAKLLQTVMTAALMFIIYEKIVRLVLTIMRVRVKRH